MTFDLPASSRIDESTCIPDKICRRQSCNNDGGYETAVADERISDFGEAMKVDEERSDVDDQDEIDASRQGRWKSRICRN